ncbi:hypothetical protein C3L33_02250, partial [Rhododendron williamsianum]
MANTRVGSNGEAEPGKPTALTKSASFKSRRKPASSASRAGSEVDDFINLLHGSDPTGTEDKDRELGDAHAEIKALKYSERLKEKAVEELSEELKKVDEKLKATEDNLESKNLELKKINEEKRAALAAQFAAEATLRRVHAAQKDDEMPPIEAIIAPLEAELKLARLEVAKLLDDNRALDRLTKSKEAALLEAEKTVKMALAKAALVDDLLNKNQELMKQIEICQEENRILDKMNRQKVAEVEKLTQTVRELEEAVLAGGAAANAVRDYQRKVQEMNEEKRILDRELARAKISANRVAVVVANEWKDANDKVMPGEMQQLRDKLAIAERTAKAEAQLKAMEVEAKKMRREVAAMEKEVVAMRIPKEQDRKVGRLSGTHGAVNGVLSHSSRSSFPSTRVSSHLLTRYGVSPMASMSSGIATEASHESTSSTYGSEQIQSNSNDRLAVGILDPYAKVLIHGRAFPRNRVGVLEGLDPVRKRPGMYIGSTGPRGLHHLVYEILDNAIDEAQAGFASKIDVVLHADNSVSITDNGRGIPTDLHPATKKSSLETVLTVLHAGGKFGGSSSGYRVSGGLHGVGLSVVNALSEALEITVWRDEKEYQQKYARGKPISTLMCHELADESKDHQGTLIRFWPDKEVFTTGIQFDYNTIAGRIRELAFLNPELFIVLKKEDADPEKSQYNEYCYAGGLVEYVRWLNTDKASQCSDAYSDTMLGYANSIRTVDGGTHIDAVKASLTRTLNNLGKKMKIFKEKDVSLSGEHTRLGNPEVRRVVDQSVQEFLTEYLELHPDVLDSILSKSLNALKAALAAKRARELVRQKGVLKSSSLPGKLADCSATNPEESDQRSGTYKENNGRDGRHGGEVVMRDYEAMCEIAYFVPAISVTAFGYNEIFIVEGDSAGGSTKQGRDRRFQGQTLAFIDRDLQDMYLFVLLELLIFTCKEDGYREYFVGFLQAVLPLRGKILNIERRDEAAMYKNQELQNLILGLGLGVKGEDFKKDALRYHKIIILTDADRALFDEGCIYVGVPPLYKVERGKQAHYCYNEAELKQLQRSFPPNASYNIQRFKGLGEMMPLQLWETTLDPERRLLKQLIVEDAAEANVVFSSLMGARVDVRKQLIQDSANMINIEQLDI